MYSAELQSANQRLGLLHLILQSLLLFVVPLMLLPMNILWGWVLLPCIAMSNPWWAYIHEALHGVLFDDKQENRLFGRLNAVLYGAPFEVLRWGHLLHHAHSRTVRERSEVYVAGRDSRLNVTIGYYFRLLGGLYLYEVLGGVLLLLPRAMVRKMLCQVASPDNIFGEMGERLLEKDNLRSARQDALAIIVVYGTAFAVYNEHAWMLAAALYGRALMISMVDNVFHYATRLDDVRYARNLEMPLWMSRLILYFNLHGAHHTRARLPWMQLPEFHKQSGQGFQGKWFRTILQQLRGPIPEHRLEQAERQS